MPFGRQRAAGRERDEVVVRCDHVPVRRGAAGQALAGGEDLVAQRRARGARAFGPDGGQRAQRDAGGDRAGVAGQHEAGLDVAGRLGQHGGAVVGGDPLGPVARGAQAADVDGGRGALGEPGGDGGRDPVGRARQPVRVEGEQAGRHGGVGGALRSAVLDGRSERGALVDVGGAALYGDACGAPRGQPRAPRAIFARRRGLGRRCHQDGDQRGDQQGQQHPHDRPPGCGVCGE